MKLQTESYDALGILQPKETLDVVSSFATDDNGSFGFPEPIVLGLWIQRADNQVEPRYLTADQHYNFKRTLHPPRVSSWIADPLDSDLGSNWEAMSIQASFTIIWGEPHDNRSIMLQALCWGYRDFDHHYAADEVAFLREISSILDQEDS